MARIMVIIGFLVAFAAGLTVGREMRRTPILAKAPADPTTRASTGPASRGSRSPGGWFASQLNLSPDQQKKMDAIWSEVARGGRQEMDKGRDALGKQRDEAILALVGPDNKPAFDKIQKDYQDEQRAMERTMRGRFEKAVEETKAVLDPEQREKYEKLLARYRPSERGGDRGRGSGGPGGPGAPGGPERENFEHRRGDGGATPNPSFQP